jgi:hypothetical protein
MRNLLSRNFLVLASLAFTIWTGSNAVAQTTIALQNPSNGELLGYQGNYSAYGYDLSYPSSFLWELRENDGYTTTSWSTGPSTTANVSLYWSTPGTFDLRLTVTYGGNSGGPGPGPDVQVRTITISPPTAGDAINSYTATNYTNTEPTSTSTAGTQGYYLLFPLLAGSVSVGPYISGTVQEQITNLRVYGVLQPDGGIVPLPATNNNVLFQTQNISGSIYIADWKYVGGGMIGTIATYTQELFFTWIDSSGNSHRISLGSTDYSTVGLTATTWEIQD